MSQADSSRLYFRCSGTRVARFAESLPSDLADRLNETPESLLELGQLLRVNGARRTVLLRWDHERFVLKHYVEPTWRHAVKQLIQPARARSTWRVSQRLADAGVATPRPLACVENRWGPLRRDSYLLYSYIEGRTLRSCLASGNRDLSLATELWRKLLTLWKLLREI